MLRLIDELHGVLAQAPLDLARAALVVAKLEYTELAPQRYLDHLDRLAGRAVERLARVRGGSVRARLEVLNSLLFEEERFAGNRAHYDDFRNSLLNVVLDRRLGIPITLALVYMEVARRAGIDVHGVAFPGHFLMRVPGQQFGGTEDDRIIDPFSGGAVLDERDCRRLLAHHAEPNDDAAFNPELLAPCTPRHMLARMLNNLKRTYVELQSFPQAYHVTELLLTVDPARLSELRDRGLLKYHLDDWPSALRDLEDYVRLHDRAGDPDRDERDRIWQHVKTLRRRLASLN